MVEILSIVSPVFMSPFCSAGTLEGLSNVSFLMSAALFSIFSTLEPLLVWQMPFINTLVTNEDERKK